MRKSSARKVQPDKQKRRHKQHRRPFIKKPRLSEKRKYAVPFRLNLFKRNRNYQKREYRRYYRHQKLHRFHK